MNPPVIESTLSGYIFRWEEERISVNVSNLNYHRDFLKGEVKVNTSLPGYAEHLHQANFNFSSTRAKADLVRTLSKICEEINWEVAIEQLRVKTLQLYRQGEPLEVLSSEDEITKIDYLLYPLIPKNQFSLIYGEGGTGKSTLALFLALLLQTKDDISDYGFSANGDNPYTALYLDWECDKQTISHQFKHLSTGLGRKAHLLYRRCNLPFVQDIENIKALISSASIDVVIIDSIGIACGGDLNEASMANSFILALRSLKTSSFAISHTSKDRQDKKTPFGSVYFFNGARNIWEIRKTQTEGDDLINIGLFHRKSNISKIHAPIGLKFIYCDDSITVKHENISEIEGFEKEISLRQRIKSLLLQEGVLPLKEIALRLDAKEQSIRNKLNDLRLKGDVTKQNDKWAFLYHDDS